MLMRQKAPQVYIEERPWGKFEQFTHNETTTVKILTVKPGEELSLQYHKKRSEFWRVLSGSGSITLGEKIIDIKPGEEYFIPTETKHTIHAGEEGVTFLEIAFGHFDEDDIIRLKDKYGR